MRSRRARSTTDDWHRRQVVYLQTVAYALGVFARHPRLTTTIVPTSRYGATCVDIYAYPSDTLYGMLYALAVLRSKETAQPYRYAPALHQLNSKPAAKLLLVEYRKVLATHYHRYRETVFDAQAMTIRRSIHLSGAKDITRRTSSFYDNVIFWKTTKLAMSLKLIAEDRVPRPAQGEDPGDLLAGARRVLPRGPGRGIGPAPVLLVGLAHRAGDRVPGPCGPG